MASINRVDQIRKILILVLLLCGAFFRVQFYAENRSLWLDEANLALNVIEEPLASCLKLPLKYDQAAPPFFLCLTKLTIFVLGSSEYALRLWPMLASILSLGLFIKLGQGYFNRNAFLIAFLFFVDSPVVIRYASEFKQYSFEMAVALLLLLMGLKYRLRPLGAGKILGLGIAGALAMWFSFSSVFILAAVGAALSMHYVLNRRFGDLKGVFVIFGIWSASIFLLYFQILSKIENNQGLTDFWANSFMPVPILSAASLEWTIDSLVLMIDYPGRIVAYRLAFFIFLIGIYALFKRDRTVFSMLLLPLVFTLIASSQGRYPFEDRLLLFYLPVVYLLIAEGFMFLINARLRIFKFFGGALLFFVLFFQAVEAPSKIVYIEDMKGALNQVKQYIKESDKIYVYCSGVPAFRYYAPRYGLDKFEVVGGGCYRQEWEDYKKELLPMMAGDRLWVVFTHAHKKHTPELKYVIDYLDLFKPPDKEFLFEQAGVLLYDFSQ